MRHVHAIDMIMSHTAIAIAATPTVGPGNSPYASAQVTKAGGDSTPWIEEDRATAGAPQTVRSCIHPPTNVGIHGEQLQAPEQLLPLPQALWR